MKTIFHRAVLVEKPEGNENSLNRGLLNQFNDLTVQQNKKPSFPQNKK
ncbi:MAG: hypothetical protein WDN00_00500 [Limisphaerales bacterium]